MMHVGMVGGIARPLCPGEKSFSKSSSILLSPDTPIESPELLRLDFMSIVSISLSDTSGSATSMYRVPSVFAFLYIRSNLRNQASPSKIKKRMIDSGIE